MKPAGPDENLYGVRGLGSVSSCSGNRLGCPLVRAGLLFPSLNTAAVSAVPRQLGDIRRDPPGFIPREQVGGIGRWMRLRLILDIRDGAIPAKGARL